MVCLNYLNSTKSEQNWKGLRKGVFLALGSFPNFKDLQYNSFSLSHPPPIIRLKMAHLQEFAFEDCDPHSLSLQIRHRGQNGQMP